jgi:hypothetical protein
MRVSGVATQPMSMTVLVRMVRVPLRWDFPALVRHPAAVAIVGMHLLLLYLSLGPASRCSPAC